MNLKTDGEADMGREFMHLTTERVEEQDGDGNIIKKNVFEPERSKRIHWINHHIHEKTPANIVVFSVVERDQEKRRDVTKTYIYDKVEKYIVVLDHREKYVFPIISSTFVVHRTIKVCLHTNKQYC